MNHSLNQLFAEKWQASSKFFMDNGYYKDMAEILKPFRTVLELGCGVGYSTLSLINNGHKVTAVEKNPECVLRANNLLLEADHEADAIFLEGDITDESFRNSIIESQKVDVVVCWSPGTQQDKNSLQYYVPSMLEYGLTIEQINENPASSYTEMMLWHACKMAKAMGAPMHIIDRCGKIDENTVAYYQALGSEIGFAGIQLGSMEAETISDGGVPLVSQGRLMNVKKMPVTFVSVLFT